MLQISQILYAYLLTIPVFFAIDMVWLGVIAKDVYQKQIGHLLASTVNWPAALIFYLVYIYGIIHFAVLPGIEKESIKTVLTNAALFGFMAYATYDLTNLATLKDWPVKIVFVDLIWGMVLTSVVAFASYHIALWVK
jgi:uncharacterized membrane protein